MRADDVAFKKAFELFKMLNDKKFRLGKRFFAIRIVRTNAYTPGKNPRDEQWEVYRKQYKFDPVMSPPKLVVCGAADHKWRTKELPLASADSSKESMLEDLRCWAAEGKAAAVSTESAPGGGGGGGGRM